MLARFLDYVMYEYMIDNILDLVKAATSGVAVDMEAVVESCHPLGLLDPAIMKSILAFEVRAMHAAPWGPRRRWSPSSFLMPSLAPPQDLGEDFHLLYRTILVDTPVGKYFTLFMQDLHDSAAAADADNVRATFTEIPMSLIENSIKKLYLEDFFYFARDVVGGETGAAMCELLSIRADVLTINVTYNRCAPHCATLSARICPSLTPSTPQFAHRLCAPWGGERAWRSAGPLSVLWEALPRRLGAAGNCGGRGRRAARVGAGVPRVRVVMGCVAVGTVPACACLLPRTSSPAQTPSRLCAL